GELRYSRVPVADPDLLPDTHTDGWVFLRDEDRALYMAFPGQGTDVLSPPPPPPRCTYNSDVVKLKKSNKMLTKQVNMIMELFRNDDKMSQMLTQLESQPEFGSGSGSVPCGDDESGDDEDGDEDEDDEEDDDRRCYIWVNIDLYLADNARIIPGDMSPGINESKNNGRRIPGDMSPGKDVTKQQNLYSSVDKSTYMSIFPADMSPGVPSISLGYLPRERIPFELFPSTYPGRQVARDSYPQVVRETTNLSVGKVVNVVVDRGSM
nr:hypothetical protein [Tanacetum cinerariifolium]